MFKKLRKRFLPFKWYLQNIKDAHAIIHLATPYLRERRERLYREARNLRKEDKKKLTAAMTMGRVHEIDDLLEKFSTYYAS
jgi:hypothetical protein